MYSLYLPHTRSTQFVSPPSLALTSVYCPCKLFSGNKEKGMSGLPLQRRIEYCFYIAATRDPAQDAFLYFVPMKDTIKYEIQHLNILSNEGKWWFAYQKPWPENESQPLRFIVLFGSEEECTVRVRKVFRRHWREFCMVSLQIAFPPMRLEECDSCKGSGYHKTIYDEVIHIDEVCANCLGVGQVECDMKKKSQFSFIDETALDRVRAEKTIEEYDKFLLRLEDEKKQRQEKSRRRRNRSYL